MIFVAYFNEYVTVQLPVTVQHQDFAYAVKSVK